MDPNVAPPVAPSQRDAPGIASTAHPARHLGVVHAAAVCVGMVIGAGIFKTAPMVAGSLDSVAAVLAAWALGGAIAIIGALCFAEMAAAFPDPGGDYHFLQLAYGRWVGFLFAWSRFAVIHTGSMALLAFVFGDYLGQVIDLGPYTSPLFAIAVIVLLVGVNLRGVRIGINTQVGLIGIVLLGLAAVGAAGAWLAWQGVPPALPRAAGPAVSGSVGGGPGGFGVAMVFVSLAYGGWSDTATLSSEMRDPHRGMTRALLLGMSAVGALYLLANWAYLRGLGLDGLAHSAAPAADLMRRAFGPAGEVLIVAAVATTSISVMNALLIAGARTTYAAARDLAAAAANAATASRAATGTAAVTTATVTATATAAAAVTTGTATATATGTAAVATAAATVTATATAGNAASIQAGGSVDGIAHLGSWNARRGGPATAIVAMGVVALLLVGLGTWTRRGFETMVDYLSPVYWLFLVCSGAALIVLRRRRPQATRPFLTPLYPALPLLFCASSAYVFYASVAYVQVGALVSLGVLAAGAAVLAWLHRRGGARR